MFGVFAGRRKFADEMLWDAFRISQTPPPNVQIPCTKAQIPHTLHCRPLFHKEMPKPEDIGESYETIGILRTLVPEQLMTTP